MCVCVCACVVHLRLTLPRYLGQGRGTKGRANKFYITHTGLYQHEVKFGNHEVIEMLTMECHLHAASSVTVEASLFERPPSLGGSYNFIIFYFISFDFMGFLQIV